MKEWPRNYGPNYKSKAAIQANNLNLNKMFAKATLTNKPFNPHTSGGE